MRLLLLIMLLFFCCTTMAAARQMVVPANTQQPQKKLTTHRRGISQRTANKIREVERISRKVALVEDKIKKKEAEIARIEAQGQ